MKTLIIGGGIAGSILAYNLAKEGLEARIIEEHSSPGFPVQCAGLVSRKCYELLGKSAKKAVENRVRGAVAFSPSGRAFEVSSDEFLGFVLERKILDMELFKRAVEAGAEPSLKAYFWRIKDNRAIIKTPSGIKSEDFDLIAGCDGPGGKTADIFGFNKPETFFSGVQIECRYRVDHEDQVEIFLGRNASPDFFGYAIPLDGETARVGIVTGEMAHIRLFKMIEKHPAVKNRVMKTYTEFNAGSIPAGLVDPFIKERAILVGDSAGQVKPYTGGGIYYGARASEMAGEAILEYKATEDIRSLNRYGIEFREEFEKEIKVGMKIVKLYSSLTDRDYEILFDIANRYSISDIISSVDMDRPSTLISAGKKAVSLIKNPKHALFFAKLLSKVMLS